MSTLSETALPAILRGEDPGNGWRKEIAAAPRPGEGGNIDITGMACHAVYSHLRGDFGAVSRDAVPFARALISWGLWGHETGSVMYNPWSITGAAVLGHALLAHGHPEGARLHAKCRAGLGLWALASYPAPAREIRDTQSAPGRVVADGEGRDGRCEIATAICGPRAFQAGLFGHCWRGGGPLLLALSIGLPTRPDPGDWYVDIIAGLQRVFPGAHPLGLTAIDASILRGTLAGDAGSAASALRWIDADRPGRTYQGRRTASGCDCGIDRCPEGSTTGRAYAQAVAVDGRAEIAMLAHDSGVREGEHNKDQNTVTTGRCDLTADTATVWSESRPEARWSLSRPGGQRLYDWLAGPSGVRLVSGDGHVLLDTTGGGAPAPQPGPTPNPTPTPGAVTPFRVSTLERPDKMMLELRAPEGSKVVRVIHGGGDGYGVRIVVEDHGHAP